MDYSLSLEKRVVSSFVRLSVRFVILVMRRRSLPACLEVENKLHQPLTM